MFYSIEVALGLLKMYFYTYAESPKSAVEEMEEVSGLELFSSQVSDNTNHEYDWAQYIESGEDWLQVQLHDDEWPAGDLALDQVHIFNRC